MRIGVISDTHIPDRSGHIPQPVMDAFKHVDLIVHAGDFVNLGAIDELRLACPKIVGVAGNMDSPEVVEKFRAKEVFEISGFKFGLMHGYGAPVNLIKLLKDAFNAEKPDVIIFGHSHKAMNQFVDGVLFFNPGSATDSVPEGASYGIIEINGKINAKIVKI